MKSLLLPKDVIYADAGFNHLTKDAVIAYCNTDMSISFSKAMKCTDSNNAELEAVKIALENNSDCIIFTDSSYVVELLKNKKVKLISRRFNIANMIVRAHKEKLISRSKVSFTK